MTAFEEMGVLPELGKAVDDMGWMLPTDVQAEAIPLILGGGDVLMAAETGSGKTGAFCLPVLQIVWETLKDIQSGKGGKHIASKAAKFSKCALNLFDRGEGMAITPDGLLCQSRDPKQWFGSRGTMGVTSKGKYYYEATVTDDGLCRVGWATLKGSLDVGTDDQSFGFGGTGKKSFCKNFDPYGESFGLKDTIGCYLDLDNNIVHFSKNDKIFPKAYDIPSNLRNAVFFPAVVLKNAEISFNFGDESLKYPPPSEFMPISQAPSSYIVLSDKKGAGPAVSSKCNKLNAPYCLIIEPSGVLASQTSNELEKFSKYLDNPTVRNLLIVGGEPAKDQMRVLEAGVDIVTGTPGRLQEFISTGQLSLQKIRFFILDEADGLLSQGHGDLINKIYASVPKVSPDGKRLQMVVCSATLHNFDVKKLAGCIENVQEKMMHFPQWVDLKGQDSVPETVHHVVVIVNPMADKKWINAKKCILTDGVHALDDIRPGSNTSETLSEAVKRLKGDYVLQAIREHKMDQALIFCRTKIDCDNMEKWLRTCGGPELSCVCLHGDRRPDERKKNLNLFKEGKVKFLICTDVAARGIDVKGMPYVINVTLPDEKQNYVHRIGRVGRADRMGLAISLVSSVPEKVWYHSCPSRGKSCRNTRLTDDGGCCIWYKEPTLLAEIEDHLGVTIQQTDPEMKIKTNEFDGKVTYGAKRSNTGSGYKGHADLLAASVKELAEMEKASQTSYLKLRYAKV